MEQKQVLVNHSCPNHFTCDVSHFTLYPNSHLTQRIQVENGQCVSVLFVILVILDVHRHRFEVYTLVSEIHENVDLVLGIKKMFELEGLINSKDCCFKFLNRSLPIFAEDHVILKPKEQKLIKVKAPFIGEIPGLAIVKILDGGIAHYKKAKIHMKHSSIRYSKQGHRNHDIQARRNYRNCRFKITRLLQN